jgi:hypothetical protein
MALDKFQLHAARMLCAWLACTAVQSTGAQPDDPAPPRYSVLLLPPRHESPDPAARAPLEAFHALIQKQLRAVPGLELRVADAATSNDAADYRVTVLSHAMTPRGMIMGRALESFSSITRSSGGTLPPPEMIGQVWLLEVAVEQRGRWISRGVDHMVLVPKPGEATARVGGSPAAGMGYSRTVCLSLAENAAQQVEMLRLQDFPQDPTIYLQFAAQVGDGALSEAQRAGALQRLLEEHRKGRFAVLDAASAASIARFAAAYPARRPQIWMAVRGIPHPQLVGTLLDSLRTDADWKVRLEAVLTLADDAGEPRVRAGLVSTARNDRHELVRMVARRESGGASDWHSYVLTTMRNGDLPPSERLVPLLNTGQTARTPEQRAVLAALVNDQKVVDELMKLARNWRADSSVSQRAPIGRALQLLSGNNDPAVVALREEYAADAQQVMLVLPGRDGMPQREVFVNPNEGLSQRPRPEGMGPPPR